MSKPVEALQQMAHITLSKVRRTAPMFGAVDGRGVPTSR